MDKKRRDPLWIIGTHRSGTTMLTDILERAGCFMGWRKDINSEATLMQRENNRLLNFSSASWDNPQAFKWLLENEDLCQIQAEQSLARFKSHRRLEFWGAKALRNASSFSSYWGWKDPRMSITAPIWLRVFKDVKIIRVIRNGVDVASSLTKRENIYLEERKKSLIHLRKMKRPVSTRCLSLAGSFSLWKEYIEAEEAWLAHNPHLKIYTCRYEDLLDSPEAIMMEIAKFLDTTIQQHAFNSIRRSRRYAYTKDKNLLDFYEKVKDEPLMSRYGYSNILED